MKALWYTLSFFLGFLALFLIVDHVEQLLHRNSYFLQLIYPILFLLMAWFCFRKGRVSAGAIPRLSEEGHLVFGMLLGCALGAFGVLYVLAHGQSLRISRMAGSRSALKQAYRTLHRSGTIEPSGTTIPFVFTNVVIVDGVLHQCAVGTAIAPFEAEGMVALSTNEVYIWLDKHRGPKFYPHPVMWHLFSRGGFEGGCVARAESSTVMKSRRFLILALAGLALIAIAVLAASMYWERKQTAFPNAPHLMSALQAFSRDQAAAGRPLPAEISAEDLVRAGYLTTNDVAGFSGMDLTFSTRLDGTPQTILAHARTSDGQYICLLADGSVQQFSRQRYEDHRASSGPAGSGNQSQPLVR